MTCRTFVSACVLAALICAPSVSAGQTTAGDEAGKWHAVVERLEPAALVSIRLKDGTRFKGTVLSVQDETFTVKPHTRIPVPGRDVRFDTLASLERTSVGMSPGKKVLIGVATGAGAVLVLAAVAIASLYD